MSKKQPSKPAKPAASKKSISAADELAKTTQGGIDLAEEDLGRVSGGMGFVFGSSKDMDCLLVRPDGSGERYVGTINKYGVDIGFTKEAQMVWLVFAPGNIAKGALAGNYGGATASATVGVGAGANVLVGGSSSQVTLQPVSVEGSVGLNIAAGIGSLELKAAR